MKLIKFSKKVINVFLITAISVSLTGCSLFHRTPIKPKKLITLDSVQEQNAGIKTEILKKRLINLQITIPAQFKAMNQFIDRIYAPVGGKVLKVFVQPGDIVKIGQALVQIKSDDIGQIELEFLDKYIDAVSNINQMSAQYNLSRQTYNREHLLFNEGISSRAEYQVAFAQMQKDKANLDSLRMQRSTLIKVYGQRVALYGGTPSEILMAASTKKIYPYITLRSNKNGIVLDRKVNSGEIIENGKELMNVADLSTIWLVGYAFEKDASILSVGQDVNGVLEESNGATVKGKLSYVASILDPDTKTLEVRADIPNKDFSIKPNMYAEMDVNIGKVNTLAVPNSAIQKYGDYNFVYVMVEPHTYEQRKVTVGQHSNGYTQVKSGLNEGETVVSQGGFSLLGESIKSQEK